MRPPLNFKLCSPREFGDGRMNTPERLAALPVERRTRSPRKLSPSPESSPWYVNVVIAGKHPAPQWLTMEAAVKHCTLGIGIWSWASNDQGKEPDVVMACCGDVPTLETLAAVSILREHLPDLKVRVVKRHRPHEAATSGRASPRAL